jgi:regulator of cell morphogenesis and NO signaling
MRLLRNVARIHAKFHPELLRIQSVFETSRQELTLHMMKEEQVLFPHIARIE